MGRPACGHGDGCERTGERHDTADHGQRPVSGDYTEATLPADGKADGAENVIRVKATVRNFPNETNMSVITEDGSFYTFSAPIIGA